MQTATIDAVQVSTEMMKGWAREWRWKGWLGDGGAGCLRIRCIGGWCWWESSLAEGHCLACVRRQGSGHHVCHFSARTQPHAAMQHTYPRILASSHPYIHSHMTNQLELQVAATDNEPIPLSYPPRTGAETNRKAKTATNVYRHNCWPG